MIDRFAIAATGNLLFGDGTFTELDNQVALRGFTHAALLSSRTFSLTERFALGVQALRKRGIGVSVIPISGEPTVASIDGVSRVVADAGCDVVVGIGGGSALDSAKAVAVMALQLARRQDTVSVKRYLEGVGDLFPPAERLGLIAIPTTAGTGSEATKNAVVADIGPQGFKKSLRHDAYIPDLVIIDPLLAKGLPREVTAASGLDALTQLMEAYTSTKANPFIDALALDAIGRIGNALPRLLESEPSDPSLRSDMAYAAYISGMAIANAGLGYV
ncbi:MAG: iron-containing alcohol dehydrogenase, partial [Erysipelotrichaceae bacterium]|nr:iron-containing alcohol dehydrogenase [Erysipelotrichaceae bacterium]